MIQPSQKGFTLLEMLTVLAIFAIMTSVVMFNYGKFTSDTVLTNMAYEIALSIREAQIYGVSVRNPIGGVIVPNSFSAPYGIYLNAGSKVYYLFADKDSNGLYKTTSVCTDLTEECVTPYTLQRGIIISDVRQKCVSDNDGLNIIFKRPNPEARFDDQIDVLTVDIELTAPDGNKRYVVVRNNGQIYVTKEKPTCSP